MKKLLSIVVLLLLLSACGEKETKSITDTKSTTDESESGEGLKVDKGLLNVEVTLPAELVEDDVDEMLNAADERGLDEVKKNPDGSITYKMSKAQHKEMMRDMKEDVLDYVNEVIDSEDLSSIQDVSYNKNFSEFTVMVNEEQFENSFDGFAMLGFAMTGMFYQAFDGLDPEKLSVTIHLQNVETGEVFNTVVYPDALEEIEED